VLVVVLLERTLILELKSENVLGCSVSFKDVFGNFLCVSFCAGVP